MLDEGLSPPDRIRHDESVCEQKRNISEIWNDFCTLDPEHFIWGIDPNETPPEVVIERVVLAPKKSLAPSEEEKSGKKRKKSKGNKESTTQVRRERDRNKSCIVM